jgi:hypothetical protein
VPVRGGAGPFKVKIASGRAEWEQAFRLLSDSYRARGYEVPRDQPFRFTPHHALPGTITLIAERAGCVCATLSLVADTALLGLPMEAIYGDEIDALRRQGRRLAEATSLADSGLTLSEFLQVFTAFIKFSIQYHLREGGDTWIIAVNPRHRSFYLKVVGFVPLGVPRSYPTVQGHPAEAFLLDVDLMRANAPVMHEKVFGEPLPATALDRPTWSPDLVRHFGERSTQTDRHTVEHVVRSVGHHGVPPRWRDIPPDLAGPDLN